MKRNILITGATGLVGSNLVNIFLEKGYRVFCLARSGNNKTAKERTIDRVKFWNEKILNKNFHNLIVIEGDLLKRNLGLNKKEIILLRKEIDEIFHSAAITEFTSSMEKISKVNVGGTRTLLDLAIEWHKNGKLKKVNYLSTVYICGDYKGVFGEDDLDVHQRFRTAYEQSKFEAEKLVQRYRKKGLWIDVFRPSLIVGDSLTGKILQFRNIYQFLHFCNSEIVNSWPFLNSYLSLVPIDLVTRSIYLISTKTTTRNNNYHIFPKKHISMKQIICVASRLLKFIAPDVVTYNSFDWNRFTPVQRNILKRIISSLDLKAELKSDYTNRILKKYNFNFPRFDDELLSRILKYFANSK